MELLEAINHSRQIADSYKDTAPDCDCALEHKQLAEWLEELVVLRRGVEVERRYVVSADGELVASGINERYLTMLIRSVVKTDPGVVIKVSLDSRFSKGGG